MTYTHETYRRLALFDLPFETQVGLNLALYRTFAIPHIAALLVRTGEIHRDPKKRAMDTGILMYEIIDAGPASERAREVIRMLNRMHRRWEISEADYGYVLTTFIVPTCRWIDRYGWRTTTADEREAITDFYCELGRLMGIRSLPTSYDEAAARLDSYEAVHLAHSEEGESLMAATAVVFRDRLPRPLRPASSQLMSLMMTDKLCNALGVDRPSILARASFGAAMRARGTVVRRLPRRKTSIFTPGASGASVYPEGYRLGDLGPRLN